MNKIVLRILKFFVRRLARTHGFFDPFDFLSRLSRFGQPSEVAVPTELLRAGAVMHARGLLNSQAIQYNMDWVWPYWVNRQFDPHDQSFVPRAFSLSHINLTHRNWTAVGLPGLDELPIVDPRGLLTPFWDGWSIDMAVIEPGGKDLIPSEVDDAQQRMNFNPGPEVVTTFKQDGIELESTTEAILRGDEPVCKYTVDVGTQRSGWLVLTIRPYNPEGISFVNSLEKGFDPYRWLINGEHVVRFQDHPDRHALSNYDSGDVYKLLPDADERNSVECDLGLASVANLYKLTPNDRLQVEVDVPLTQESKRWSLISDSAPSGGRTESWSHALKNHCSIDVPDPKIERLYDTSLRTLTLLSPGDVYPGPFTYRRFWFRDAAFIVHSLLCSNLEERAYRTFDNFFERQNADGYFSSQKGEWDSNGEVLWVLNRYCQLTDRSPDGEWVEPIREGVQWIIDKRLPSDGNEPHTGLLPAGFSAEHFGPNDYYYWDDFWAVAGLQSAAELLERSNREVDTSNLIKESVDLFDCIFQSVMDTTTGSRIEGIPASPYRSMDAGAVGSLVAGYPLQLVTPRDDRLLETAEYLRENCFVNGAFFQEMIHSGLNPYLSLHVAQVYLRAGERTRAWEIVESVGDLASSTGQWPEAVHPATDGGCMGDGQHAWAAADWNVMIRNMFVREERNEKLVIGSGIPSDWLQAGETLRFGPTRTRFGTVSVQFNCEDSGVHVELRSTWFDGKPTIEVDLPGYETTEIEEVSTFLEANLA